MNEDIVTRFTLDESEAFGSVKPLDDSLFHGTTPL
jgi:hypothetical protein